jgi:hypothetical protein
VKNLLLLVLATSACNWTTFDDLQDQVTTRAEETPDGVKATDYGFDVAGATEPGNTSGGKVAVLSTGPGNYSTLELDPGGTVLNVGDSETLGQHTIDSLTTGASVLFDGVSQVALIDNSNVGTVVVITGTPDGLSVDQQVGTSAKPDAVASANGEVVVAVTATAGMPNVFAVKGTSVVNCTLVDSLTGMPLSTAAIAIDGTNLYAYTKTGELFQYSLTALDNPAACTSLGEVKGTAATAVPPAPSGGHLDIVASKYAVLTAFDTSASGTSGKVTVVDISAVPTVVGTPIAASGVHSATFNTFDGQGVVVLGYPFRNDADKLSVGAVDLHKIDVGTGVLDSDPTQILTIPGADANHIFGRSVTTTNYNGLPIVVASADNTVYTFYATALYSKR